MKQLVEETTASGLIGDVLELQFLAQETDSDADFSDADSIESAGDEAPR